MKCRNAVRPATTADEQYPEYRLHIKRKVGDDGLCATCRRAQRVERTRAARAQRVLRTYQMSTGRAMTREDHDELFRRQGGRCPHGLRITLRSPVDHDHASGAVRGLLCDPCNRFLGYVKDSPQALLNLWAYLLRPPAQVAPVTDHAFVSLLGLVQCTFGRNRPDGACCGRLEHEHRVDPDAAVRRELDVMVAALAENQDDALRIALWQKVSLTGIEPTYEEWRDL